MSNLTAYHIPIDIQDTFLGGLPQKKRLSFKPKIRTLADKFREHNIPTIWPIYAPKEQSFYCPPEDRMPGSEEELYFFSELAFDPKLIADDEAFLIKKHVSTLDPKKNPLKRKLDAEQDTIRAFFFSGQLTKRCVAHSIIDAAGFYKNVQCYGIIDHMADMTEESVKAHPPSWHQKAIESLCFTGKRNNVHFATAKEIFSKLQANTL